MNEDNYWMNLARCNEATLTYGVQDLLREAMADRSMAEVRDLAVKHSQAPAEVPSLASLYKVLRWEEGAKGFSVGNLLKVRDTALIAIEEG